MSFNVSNLANTETGYTKSKSRDAVKKNPDEIKLFSNQKVASDINSIAAKYGSANFDDEREYTALGNYIEQFKANLSESVQRFLNGILNKTTSYTAEQIQEMASHADKATAERTVASVNEFAGTMEILTLLGSCNEKDKIIKTQNAEQLWANAASKTDKATAERVADSVNEFAGTLEILDLIS